MKKTQDFDLLYSKAKEIIKKYNIIAVSLFQRELSIDYDVAAKILKQLETEDLVGTGKEFEVRKVLKK